MSLQLSTARPLAWAAAAAALLAVPAARPATGQAAAAQPASTTVAGTVYGIDGKPAVGATVAYYRIAIPSEDDLPVLQAKTGPDGAFTIDLGQPAAAGAGGKQPGFTGILVARTADGVGLARPNAPSADIHLTSGCDIHLTFQDEYGIPIASAPVRVRSIFYLAKPALRDFFALPAGAQADFSATTGPDGTAVIKDLPRGASATIDMQDDRFATVGAQGQVMVEDAASMDVPPIKVPHAATIEGIATYAADGKPAAGVRLTAMTTGMMDRSTGVATTDKTGAFVLARLRPGRYAISGAVGDRAAGSDLVVRPVDGVVVTANGHKRGVRLLVVKGATVTGTAIDQTTGAPIPNAYVSVMAKDGVSATGVPADAQGRFKVILPGGSYRFFTGSSEGATSVTVAEGQTATVTVTGTAPPQPGIVTGTVVDATGKPVAGAAVVAASVGIGLDDQTATTDAQGAFSFRLGGNIPVYLIRARSGSRATATATAAIAGDKVTLRLSENATSAVAGVVQDTGGAPIANTQVSLLQWAFNSGTTIAQARTDARGAYRFPDLWPDPKYSLTASADGYGSQSVDSVIAAAGRQVTVDPIRLVKADSFIGGQVLSSKGAPLVGVEVDLNGASNKRTQTDTAGRFFFEGVPRGNLVVMVQADGEFASVMEPTGKNDLVIKTMAMNQDPAPAPAPGAGAGSPAHGPDTTIKRQASEFQVAGWSVTPGPTLAQLRGKVVLVDIFGCCADSLYQTQQFTAMLAAHGVVGIGLSVDTSTTAAALAAHLKDEHVTMPVAVDRKGPRGTQTATDLGTNGFESYAVLDRDGRIVYAGFDLQAAIASVVWLIQVKP